MGVGGVGGEETYPRSPNSFEAELERNAGLLISHRTVSVDHWEDVEGAAPCAKCTESPRGIYGEHPQRGLPVWGPCRGNVTSLPTFICIF